MLAFVRPFKIINIFRSFFYRIPDGKYRPSCEIGYFLTIWNKRSFKIYEAVRKTQRLEVMVELYVISYENVIISMS